MRSAQAAAFLLIALSSCGDRVIDLERPCVRARLLPILPDMITRSGRTLTEWGLWRVDQIEPDGTVTSSRSRARSVAC